jgi:superfamily II DNA helicase RecQ
MAQAIADDLRTVDYKATGTLQRSIDLLSRLDRGDFDALLDSMVRARLIEIEDAVFEKDGEVKRYRKVRLTATGLELRPSTPLDLLLSDGVVKELSGPKNTPVRSKKSKSTKSESKSDSKKSSAANSLSSTSYSDGARPLSVADEALASRIKEWRAALAKQLRVPAYVVLHDRSVNAIALARPKNPRQLLDIGGMGPAKVERFGEEILELLSAEQSNSV